MDLSSWSWWDRVVVAAAALAPPGIAAALVPFRASFPNTDAALVLVVVIVAVAANGRRLAGLLAAASAAIWFDFFLTAPYEHFTITRRADIETTILLLVVGAAVTELAVRGRQHRLRAQTDARYLAAIGSTSVPTAAGGSAWEVTNDVAARLTEILGLRACRFERTLFGGMPRLEPDGRVRAGNKYLDVEANGMPSTSLELLARSNGRVYGRFVLEPVSGAPIPLEARRVATILAGQAAAANADQAPARR
jgi:Domain of unknown function (DUF4118)